MNVFMKNCTVRLVDYNGLSNEHGFKLLANYIAKSNYTIKPLHINCFGDVVGVEFGDGLIDLSINIPSEFIKYFIDDVIETTVNDITNILKPKPNPFSGHPLIGGIITKQSPLSQMYS